MDPKKRISSLKQYPVLAAFTLFFAALFVLDLVTPDRAYSELENTTLTQRPKLTAVSVDGLNNYFTNYTKYVKDQVFGRDQWISLQSLAETALFQKTQSGGILLGREHRMFARRYRVLPTEERVWNKNLAAVQSLGERYPGKVSFMLVPSASVLYPEDLPLAAPQMDRKGGSTKRRRRSRRCSFSASPMRCGRTRTSICTIAPTTTGRRWGLTTPTSSSAKRRA